MATLKALCQLGWIAAVGLSGLEAVAADTRAADTRPVAAAAQPVAVRERYRVREIRRDAVLGQNWAVLEDEQHPERPLHAELTQLPATGQAGASQPEAAKPVVASAMKAAVPVVHYGDKVTVWHTETNVRLAISAVAEGSAAVGERVALRMNGAGQNGETGWRITGVVRGPSDVEMEP